MRAFIKTEGGNGIGHGHVMRCLALGQAFVEAGIAPEMWIRGDVKAGAVPADFQLKFDSLSSSSSFWNSIKDSDIVVVDSYLDTIHDYSIVSNSTKVAVYLDDTGRLQYPRGVILNGVVGATPAQYPWKEKGNDLLGPEFILMRKNFWDVAPAALRSRVGHLLVTFGGEDPKRLTLPTLQLLNNEFPNLKKRVICGAGFKNAREIRAHADSHTEIIDSPNAEQLIAAMEGSDLAVSAGGQTLNELARLGLPTVIVKVAENQTRIIQGWTAAGFGLLAGSWDDKGLMQSIKENIAFLMDLGKRQKMAAAGKTLSDGQGARRAVRKILEMV